MKVMLKGMFLSCALLMLTGCANMYGTWAVDSVEPEAAAKNFEFAKVTLNEDGTYVAEVTYDEKTRESKGEYTYEDGKLTFKGQGGHDRTYDATFCGMCNKLIVKGEEHGEAWEATMKKVKCCSDCGDKCEESCDKSCSKTCDKK